MPSSFSLTWALYPNSTGRPTPPLRIGRAWGSCRLTSRDAPSDIYRANRARAWATIVAVRSMVTANSSSAHRSPPRIRSVRARQGQAVVAHHRGGLGRRRLRQVSGLIYHPADHRRGSSRLSLPWLRNLTATSRIR